MKKIICLMVFVISVSVFGQGNKKIEDDLYNHYKKTQSDFYEDEVNYNQISSENKIFISKLIEYLKSEPSSIESDFGLLVKDYFKVIPSRDGNFRIYNWAINLGGHYSTYYNITQYRYKDKNGIWEDKENNYEGSDVIKIFQTELNDKQYYFPYTYSNNGSVQEQHINSFQVSSKGLQHVDLTSSIGFAYHRTDIFNGNDFQIQFNEYTNDFTVPFVYPQSLEMTTETVKYEFDGKKYVMMPDFNRVEGDLFSHFNQINYWNNRKFSEERNVNIRLENDIFKAKLIYYLTKYPELINYDFYTLTEAGLKILVSKDGKFRSYSWSNNITSISFSNDWNVCQYSDGKESVAFSEQAGDVLNIFSSKVKSDNYYFVLYHYNGMGGTRTRYQLLKAYNGYVVRPDIFGLPSDNKYSIGEGLYVNYDYSTINEDEEQPIHKVINYNSANGVFSAQQVNSETMKVIDKYVKYTFDGYKFIEVK